MKTPFILFALLLHLAAGMAWGDAKLNVILIISDDHGHPDYGFMGSKNVVTPHIDKLAAEGVLYTRGYTMPVCSPSLASLLTGKYPHAHGITGNDLAGPKGRGGRAPLAQQLLQNSVILPKTLTDAGHLTFQTGKLWNVTYAQVGFTGGMTNTAGRHGDAGLSIGRKGMKPIMDFMDQAREQKKPFFVWYAPFLHHDPHTPPERLLTKYRGKGPTEKAEAYYAMVE